jgi:hypothetical protein
MSSLVSLFLCMTLIYFAYATITYKVVLVYMGDMFLCSSHVHNLEACVLDEHNLLIQLKGDVNMFMVFVHSLESHVLDEHDPLIHLNRHRKGCICLYD